MYYLIYQKPSNEAKRDITAMNVCESKFTHLNGGPKDPTLFPHSIRSAAGG